MGVRELNDVLVNAYEAAVDATTDGKTDEDKANIAKTLTKDKVETILMGVEGFFCWIKTRLEK